MNKPRRSNLKKMLSFVAALVVLGVLLTAGGFTFAATQESHDPFCASCHTQPESTYYQRSTAANNVDLASYHTGQKTRCIDCHSGVGVLGRMQSELMGARNAFMWYTGNAVQPAVVKFPIGDDHCLKCHQDVVQTGYTAKLGLSAPAGRMGREGGEGDEGERANHWHEQLARWLSSTADAGTCLSCHASHPTDGDAQNGFMNAQSVQAACEACHRVLGEEGD